MLDYFGPMLTLWWLWRMPWASDTDLSRVSGQTREAISRQLARRPDLVYRVRVGRRKDAVYRHVFSPQGVASMEQEHGWVRAWHHSPSALRLLFERLELVEFCYTILPDFWRSTLAGPWGSMAMYAGVYGDGNREYPGQRIVVSNEIHLVDLQWLPSQHIDLVAVYQAANPENLLLVYLPVAFYGFYQQPSTVRSWQAEMEAVLEHRGYWGNGPPEEEWYFFYAHLERDFDPYDTPDPVGPKRELCYPSLLLIVPTPVIGLQVLRQELDKDPIDIGVIDLSGRVIKPLKDMCLYWEDVRAPERPVHLRGFEALRKRVENSYWATLNGHLPWAIFQFVHDYAGSGRQEIFYGCGIAPRTANAMIDAQIKAGLMHEVSGQLYLTDLGLVTYAQSCGVHPTRVRGRLREYAKDESGHRDEQSSHNLKTAQCAVKFLQEGVLVFSGLHITWDFQPQGTQVRPDFVLVLKSPDENQWVVVCGELEQNAKGHGAIVWKFRTFRRLAGTLDELTLPVSVITLTRRNAETVVALARGMGVVVTDFDTFMNDFPGNCWAAELPDNSDPDEPPDNTISFENALDHFITSIEYPAWTLTLVPFGPQRAGIAALIP